MDDEVMNCDIPTSAPLNFSMHFSGYTILIKLHRLCSLVWNSLSSAKAFRKKPEELIQTVDDLDHRIRLLAEEIEKLVPLKSALDPSRLPENLSLTMALAIQFTYFGLLFDIHTTLTYPWSRGIISLRQHPSFRLQVERSYSVVAKASRDIILARQTHSTRCSLSIPVSTDVNHNNF